MTDDEKQAMARYGITHEIKNLFHFRGYRYDRLEDAISYAKKVGPDATPPKREPIE